MRVLGFEFDADAGTELAGVPVFDDLPGIQLFERQVGYTGARARFMYHSPHAKTRSTNQLTSNDDQR